jgi:hypothetical protein
VVSRRYDDLEDYGKIDMLATVRIFSELRALQSDHPPDQMD